MSKKNKKNKQQAQTVYSDPYEAAMHRAQNDIDSADYSINEVELDENGDPIEPEYEYEYEEAPKKKKEQVLTPDYMAYLMGGIKESKKKKQKKSYDEDYDLDFINEENSEINVRDALNHVAKQANADYEADRKRSAAKEAEENDPYLKAMVSGEGQCKAVNTPDFMYSAITSGKHMVTEDDPYENALKNLKISDERCLKAFGEYSAAMAANSVKHMLTEDNGDAEDIFPQEFDNGSEDTDDDGFFGNPLNYDEEDDVENADSSVYNSDDFGIGVGSSYPGNGEDEIVSENDVNYDAAKMNEDSDEVPPMAPNASEIYFKLSHICALQFPIFEELGRMNINDGIVSTPVIDSVLNLDCYYVNQDGLYKHFLGDDGKLDLKLLANTKRGMWMYIISSKHPAALYTVPEFMEAFKNVKYLDTKNFQFVYDEHINEDAIEPTIYAYHIPASEQRKFNNYVRHAAVGFTSSDEFYPELNASERSLFAEFIVYCNICATIRNEREIFARHIPEYIQAFRFASKKYPDGSMHPAYNQLIEFTELVHRHRKTEVGTEEFTFDDLDGIFGIDDFDQIRDLVFEILEIVDGEEDDDEDDEEIDFAMIPNSEMVDTGSEEEDEEEDPMDALSDQASQYAEDTTDYAQYLTEPQNVEDTVDDLSNQLYDRYAATAKENGEEVLSREELASRMKQNVTGAMSMVQHTDGSAELTSTTVAKTEVVEAPKPNVEEVPAVEVTPASRNEDVGSNAMREALLKCGARPSNTSNTQPANKKSMVIPVVRK